MFQLPKSVPVPASKRNAFQYKFVKKPIMSKKSQDSKPTEAPAAQSKKPVMGTALFPWSINGTPVFIRIDMAHSWKGEDYSYGPISGEPKGAFDFTVLDMKGKNSQKAKALDAMLNLQDIRRIEEAGFAFLYDRVFIPRAPREPRPKATPKP